jgi:putative redox protein
MEWKGGLAFEGENAWGHRVRTDAPASAGGAQSGARPTELLLYGIAGCTGIDIVRILDKQRQKVTDLRITVQGEQHEAYPRPFHSVRIHYVLRGEDLDETKVARAIGLSESKYCVVSQTVQQPTEVTTSFEVLAG